MKNIHAIPILLVLLSSLALGITMQDISYLPEEGVVKNEKCAVAIAEAVLSDVYGAREIKWQKPFVAILVKDETWVVSGTFPKNSNLKGGVAYIKIRKKDGAILGMTHEK